MVMRYRPRLRRDDLFVAISCDNSLAFKTGTQRSERPVFINKIAPCRHACPIGIDISTAFHLVSQGDIDGALRTYLQDNPLPGVCGRVCYHPCEAECSRGNFDECISIRSFERFIADHGQMDIRGDVPVHSRKEKIAVIGSGPAGLSTAYHMARLGYQVTIFEGRSEIGGMLRYGIPSYRLPRSVLDRDIQRIQSLGIDIQGNTTVGKEVSWKELASFGAIFLAVGLQSGKILFEPFGVESAVITGVEFLADPQKWSLDESTQKTLIIGGGNVAIDAARTLLRVRNGNGSNITVICPESRDQMPALSEEVNEALEEGINIVNGWAPDKLHKKDGKLVSLDFYQAEIRIDEASGTLEIMRAGKEVQKHLADKLIVAIGQGMESDILPPGIEVKGGKVVVDEWGITSLPKFFAGGDAIGEKAFVADAIASGKRGALAISCFLRGRDADTEFQAYHLGKSHTFSFRHFIEGPEKDLVDLKRVVSFDHINTLFFCESPRNNPDRLDPGTRKSTFEEVTGGLEPRQMEEEIARCFRCGTCIDCENCLDFCPDISIIKDARLGMYGFDSDYCKGCGMCSVACPRGVVEMVEETT